VLIGNDDRHGQNAGSTGRIVEATETTALFRLQETNHSIFCCIVVIALHCIALHCIAWCKSTHLHVAQEEVLSDTPSRGSRGELGAGVRCSDRD
jgi:hypothetical protein